MKRYRMINGKKKYEGRVGGRKITGICRKEGVSGGREKEQKIYILRENNERNVEKGEQRRDCERKGEKDGGRKIREENCKGGMESRREGRREKSA